MPTTTKKIWLWFAPIALVAAAASSAGVYAYVMRERANAQAARTVHVAPLLVSVAPMTVNLRNIHDEPMMLYVGFNLEVGNEATQKLLVLYMPRIRSQLLTVLSGQDSDELATPQGKNALAAKILELLRSTLAADQPDLALLGVLYTDFIVQ